MNIDDWKTQIKRGVLEYCILLLIYKSDSYGYDIMNQLSMHPIITSKESTIYPLLRRLEKEGFTSSYWKEAVEGLPPRKYYTITPQGKDFLSKMSEEWVHLESTIKNFREDLYEK